MTTIGSRCWSDLGDGLQNLWNLWWFREALVHLHQSPWFTQVIHFPYGTTLVAHTFNPFNGLLAVILRPLFSLPTTYNLIVLFSFVMTGWGGLILSHLKSKLFHPYSSKKLRFLNEVPTLLMIIIVIMVILRPFT